MQNGYSHDLNIIINEAAIQLADVFQEYSEVSFDDSDPDETGHVEPVPVMYLTSEGMEKMGELFGSIDPRLRANVFATLLVELEERGIEYDVDQFGTTEAVH